MKRISTPEYLGANGQFTAAEVQASLADLRMFNRWFGGTRVMRSLFRRVIDVTGSRKLRWLDVAAASGDIAQALSESFAEDGIELQAVALDRALEHLRADSDHPPFRQKKAKGWGTREFGENEDDPPFRREKAKALGTQMGLRAVQGDALALPFADGAFDVVATSLLLHDLEPPEVQKFVREALRVARVAVLINELRRSWTHLALVYAGMPLFSRITRHDAPASVKKAYTPAEMVGMIGGHRYELKKFYLCRMGMIVWKNTQAEEI